MQTNWKPSRKWLAAQATAIGGLAIMLLTGDKAITDPEIIAIVTFFVQAVTTYLLPNKEEGVQPVSEQKRV